MVKFHFTFYWLLLLFCSLGLAAAAKPSPVLPPAGDALSAYEQGYALYRAGRFLDAEQRFHEALDREPNLLKAHYWLGKLYREMGMLQEANFHWEEVLRLNELIAGRRRALQIEDNEYPAERQLLTTTRRQQDAEEHYRNGRRLQREGHWDGAIAELKQAVALFPAHSKYVLFLARLRWDREDRQGAAKTSISRPDWKLRKGLWPPAIRQKPFARFATSCTGIPPEQTSEPCSSASKHRSLRMW